MRLRHRLLIFVVVSTALTLGGALLAIGWAVNGSQQRQLDQALLHEAREEAAEASQLGGHELAISEGPGPMANDIGPLTKYGAIYTPDGRVLAQTETFHGRPPAYESLPQTLEVPFDFFQNAEHLRAVWTAIPGHSERLLLAAPRADLDADAAFQTRAMWIVLLTAVAWTALVAGWLLRRMTRGQEEVAQVARRVSAGDLSARVGAAGGGGEVEQLGADVNHMVEQLGGLLAAQKEFVAYAAHELRAPLTTLYGELQHALRKERDAESYRRTIGEALEACQRLKSLSEDLLTLARVSGTAAPRTRLAAAALAAAAVAAVEDEAQVRGVAVVVEGAAPDLVGHETDLVRLLRNLIENAVRHSPRDAQVRVRLDGAGERVRLSIDDDGVGVREEDRARIFEPFFRGREVAPDTPGAGLGLAIALRIARNHGGELALATPALPARGASFVLTLPAA